jgi:hypothetical protein
MKTPKSYFIGLFGAFLMFAFHAELSAQKDGKADFAAAVDQINCETVKFIHREAGRNATADKMECFTFESIYKSIPDDEASSTGRLSKDLNNYKAKYNAKEDLGKQLDVVIAYAENKITKKKRKGSVEDYKARLAEDKKEALESFNQSAAEPAANGKKDNEKKEPAVGAHHDDSAKATTRTETKSSENTEIMPADSAPKEGNYAPSWLGWLALIASLLSLGFAAYALSKLNGIANSGGAARNEPAPEYTRPSAPLVRESPDNYKLVEMKLNDEIRNLRSYFEGRLTEMNAAMQAKAPEEEYKPSLKEFEFSPADLEEETFQPIVGTTAPVEQTTVSAEEEEKAPTPAETKEEEPKEATHKKEEPEVKADEPPTAVDDNGIMPTPIQPSLFGMSDEDAKTPIAVATKNFEDELDTSLLPTYRFSALSADGKHFNESQFTEDKAPDSIFEIESYADVPGRAFFSVLNYPAVVEKVLADPATYLEPYCNYEGDDPKGKTRIVLLEEGILQKEDGNWLINNKAHVKFE